MQATPTPTISSMASTSTRGREDASFISPTSISSETAVQVHLALASGQRGFAVSPSDGHPMIVTTDSSNINPATFANGRRASKTSTSSRGAESRSISPAVGWEGQPPSTAGGMSPSSAIGASSSSSSKPLSPPPRLKRPSIYYSLIQHFFEKASAIIEAPLNSMRTPASQKRMQRLLKPMRVARSGGVFWALADSAAILVGLVCVFLIFVSGCVILFGEDAARGYEDLFVVSEGEIFSSDSRQREGEVKAVSLADADKVSALKQKIKRGRQLLGKAAIEALVRVASLRRRQGKNKNNNSKHNNKENVALRPAQIVPAGPPLAGPLQPLESNSGDVAFHHQVTAAAASRKEYTTPQFDNSSLVFPSIVVDEAIHEIFGGGGGESVGIIGRDSRTLAKERQALRESVHRRRERELILESLKARGALPPAELRDDDEHSIFAHRMHRGESERKIDALRKYTSVKKRGGVPKLIIRKNAHPFQEMSLFSSYPHVSHDLLSLATLSERANFDDDATFFVSIAQFQDVLCPQTIMELYTKARNPRRIFTGIVDQRDPQTSVVEEVGKWIGSRQPLKFSGQAANYTCMPWYMLKKCATSDFCPTDNIRVRHSLPLDSKGPTWGRAVAMLMYQDESYFMMIDSHSRFVAQWDYQIILNLNMVPKSSKKPILSHYPGIFLLESDYEPLNHRREQFAMMMCFAKYLKDIGIIRMVSQAFVYIGYPTIQPFSAGGFVVGDAQFVHEVPFDPHLHYVFDGEEILYSARLWTHGYDLFTPRNNILFHHYERHDSPKYWDSKRFAESRPMLIKGQSRVRYFMKTIKQNSTTNELMVTPEKAQRLGVDLDEHLYGMGKDRKIEDYYNFAGVDPVKWIVKFEFCRNTTIFQSTPFKYHPRGWPVSLPDSV